MSKKTPQSFFNLGISLFLFTVVCSGCKHLPVVKQISEADANFRTKQTEEAIKNSSVLQELNTVCESIPLPSNFKFIGKGGLDDQKITLSINYHSETNYRETWLLLRKYFAEKGWRSVKDGEGVVSSLKNIEFTNNQHRIVAHYNESDPNIYSIYCEKLKR